VSTENPRLGITKGISLTGPLRSYYGQREGKRSIPQEQKHGVIDKGIRRTREPRGGVVDRWSVALRSEAVGQYQDENHCECERT
jgi:hypothetical protein